MGVHVMVLSACDGAVCMHGRTEESLQRQVVAPRSRARAGLLGPAAQHSTCGMFQTTGRHVPHARRFTTVCPLVIVLTINAIKEIVDDYYRHKVCVCVGGVQLGEARAAVRSRGGMVRWGGAAAGVCPCGLLPVVIPLTVHLMRVAVLACVCVCSDGLHTAQPTNRKTTCTPGAGTAAAPAA